MASDKEGDRSLSGRGKSGSQGSGTSTGWGGSSTGTSKSGSSKSGSQGSGTSSSWGGKSTGGGSTGSGTPGSSPGGGWNSGGSSAPAGRAGGGGTGTGPAPARSATPASSATGYTGGGPTGSSPRGLGFNLSPAKTATTSPSAITPSLTTGRALRSAATPTGFAPDLNRRPDLNPTISANAALQSALAMTRAKEHKPGTDPYSSDLYNTVFGSTVVPGLIDMTPRQVMEYQKTMPRSRAVGAYQIKDIPWAAKLAGIDLDKDKFSIATQDRMATALAARRIGLATDKKTGAIDTQKAAIEIANEWTSYAHPVTGKSAVPKNNKARGGPGDTFTAVQNFVTAFAPGATPAAATSATAALERLAAPVPANVPIPTARPSPVNSFATRPNVPVGALQAAATARVVSKYLGAGRPGVVTPASGFTPDRAARQAISGADVASRIGPTINGPPSTRDIAERTAFSVAQANAADLAASTGYRPGTTPPSQALAPGPVGAGFSSAISPQEGPARQVSHTGASLTSLDAPGLRTRMSGSEDIARTLRGEDVDPMDPGAIGAGFSAAGFGTVAPIGRVDTGDTVNAYNRANPAPQVGPPTASLTSRTVSQGLATALPNLPAVDTLKRDLGARTVMRSVDEAAQSTVPNLDEAPKAKVTNPGFALPQKTRIVDAVAASVAAAAPPGYTVNVRSGKRTAKGSGRHSDLESALDFEIRDETGRVLSYRDPDDRKIMNAVALTAARNYGVLGFGAGEDYMGATAMHFDMATTKQINPRTQDQEWEAFNAPELKAALAEGRAYYAARASGQPGSVTQTAGGPDATTAATTTDTSATTPPAGTGPAVGPQGDATPDPVTGKFPPEPLTQGQKVLSFFVKLGASTLGGTAGTAVTVFDMLDEAATGQGFIDSLIAKLDNPRTGGAAPTGFGAYAQGGHEPTLSAVKAEQQRVDQRVLDKYLKPQTPVTPPAVTTPVETTFNDPTWRPTPTQLWGPQNKYSEFRYAAT